MKQFATQAETKLALNSDIISESSLKYVSSFKTMDLGDKYALLQVHDRRIAMNSAVLREESAHLHAIDCFECPSPHSIAA